MRILFINAQSGDDRKRHESSELLPCLALLTLMSNLQIFAQQESLLLDLDYLDGQAIGNEAIKQYIRQKATDIDFICCSVLALNFADTLEIIDVAKSHNSKIITVVGNDHFSVLYERIMRRRTNIDFGFRGNDVVQGFCKFILDHIQGRTLDLDSYAGLVYRTPLGEVRVNPEDPTEYEKLSHVDFALMDRTFSHSMAYIQSQWDEWPEYYESRQRMGILDFARGCLKFAGARYHDIPVNACDFCGIIPGGKVIQSAGHITAWERIRNVFDQGYNVIFLTADDLPLTFWPLLQEMARNQPDWYKSLPPTIRPRLSCYARAEFFHYYPERVDTLINELGFQNFTIGIDGLSDLSLAVMNKTRSGWIPKDRGAMEINFSALRTASQKGCHILASTVVTHLGINREIMEENFSNTRRLLEIGGKTLRSIDFYPTYPAVGSHAFEYLSDPQYALKKASAFGLRVNYDVLMANHEKYKLGDCFDLETMYSDFIAGCCPDITMDEVNDYLERLILLSKDFGIENGGVAV